MANDSVSQNMKVKEIELAGIQFISKANPAKWIPLNKNMKVKEIELAGIQFISKANPAKWIPLNISIIPFLAPSTSLFHGIFYLKGSP